MLGRKRRGGGGRSDGPIVAGLEIALAIVTVAFVGYMIYLGVELLL